MTKLKSCPFCGEVEDLLIMDEPSQASSKEQRYFVYCCKCGTQGPIVTASKGKITSGLINIVETTWNNRI